MRIVKLPQALLDLIETADFPKRRRGSDGTLFAETTGKLSETEFRIKSP